MTILSAARSTSRMPDQNGSAATIIKVQGLCVEIDHRNVDIDTDVSLAIHQGEVLGLVGESASGKTTAATSLLNHQRRGAKITSGQVLIDGRDVLSMDDRQLREVRGGLISYVPQDSSAALNPALRIGTQLIEVLNAHDFGDSAADRRKRLQQMMAEVLLPSDRAFLHRYPHQLSGGQQQRVAIAMAFACRPKVIVLDEPTTALDVTTQGHVLETIRDLTRAYGVAALYVTHDLAVVSNLADRIAVMYAGRIVELGTRDELFAGAWHPYTRKLLAAIPDLTGERQLRGIPGWAPQPGHRPCGCAFAPRCDMSTEKCMKEFPPVVEEQKHLVRCWRWQSPAVMASGDSGLRTPRPDEETSRAVVEVRNLTAYYQRRETLHDINVSLAERRCLSLVGESGSGKTTLARCIAGLHPFKTEGDVLFEGQELAAEARGRQRRQRRAIQYIFQSPYSSLNPRRTIRQILAEPLRLFFDLNRDEMEDRQVAALGAVALDSSLLARYPDQLSGGERQRVAIARALAAEPTVLICDEVTSWLDVSVQAAIIELLAKLQTETGVAMLFVTHNLALVRAISQEVAVMHDGRIVEHGNVNAVLRDPQAEYTRKLLADTPSI